MTAKIITTSIAALTLAGAVAATSTPAAAWHYHHGGWGGPAIAAGVVGGLALGAMAASSQPYYATCVTREAVYDSWGNFRGYRRVRVAC